MKLVVLLLWLTDKSIGAFVVQGRLRGRNLLAGRLVRDISTAKSQAAAALPRGVEIEWKEQV